MALKQELETTPVRRLNLRDPVTIQETATIREAIETMRTAGLGCVIAVDSDNRASGIFTEAMLRHCLNDGPSVLDDSVASQMVERLPWVSPDDEARMVLDSMEMSNMRFIAVLDKERQVVGIAGQKSMMEFVAEFFPEDVMTQDLSDNPPSLSREGA